VIHFKEKLLKLTKKRFWFILGEHNWEITHFQMCNLHAGSGGRGVWGSRTFKL